MQEGGGDRQPWQRAGVQRGDQGQNRRRCMKGEGFEAVLMGPAGPFAPGWKSLEHGPGGCHVFHLEIRSRTGGPEGDDAGDNSSAGQDQRPGVGSGIRGGEQLQQRHRYEPELEAFLSWRLERTRVMASTSSFDVVSDFDRQELVNTLDQVRRDVGNRYDLKDSNTEIELEETELVITTASDMTLQAVEDVLRTKATKRNLSLKIFDFQTPESVGGNRVKQVVKLRKGLSQEIAKKLSKIVRDELKKVTVAIQGESVRITGKSKDDLQAAIQLVKSKEDELDVPLQFENYR